jgi:hypothetical protein
MTLASLFDLGAAQSWNAPLVLLLIKATLILVTALGITLAMQRASAGARHLVWLVTLVALLLIPALTAWAPLRLEILPAEPMQSAVAPPITRAPARAGAPRAGVSAEGVAPMPSVLPVSYGATVASDVPSEPARGVISALRGASVWSVALGVWAMIAAAILLSLTWSSLVGPPNVRPPRPLHDKPWKTPFY